MSTPSELDPARTALEAYVPADEDQAAVRERMLAFLDAHPEDAHKRELAEGHLTASALVFDPPFERVLLTHHKKLGRWLQLGGHCDGDPNLESVALRECREESGIPSLLSCFVGVLDLDIHTIPARPNEPEHLHFDVRYMVWNAKGAPEQVGEESNSLDWFTAEEIEHLNTDESVRRLVRRGFERVVK